MPMPKELIAQAKADKKRGYQKPWYKRNTYDYIYNREKIIKEGAEIKPFKIFWWFIKLGILIWILLLAISYGLILLK